MIDVDRIAKAVRKFAITKVVVSRMEVGAETYAALQAAEIGHHLFGIPILLNEALPSSSLRFIGKNDVEIESLM